VMAQVFSFAAAHIDAMAVPPLRGSGPGVAAPQVPLCSAQLHLGLLMISPLRGYSCTKSVMSCECLHYDNLLQIYCKHPGCSYLV
jgi:hypothetical protein